MGGKTWHYLAVKNLGVIKRNNIEAINNDDHYY